MKTDETKRLEMEIWNATNKQGVFGCFEVTIGWFGKERVDYMTYDTKGTFRCYEIKVTKADFHSPCHNSFVGHLNYYVLPVELYEAVQDEIQGGTGKTVSAANFAHILATIHGKRVLLVDGDKRSWRGGFDGGEYSMR